MLPHFKLFGELIYSYPLMMGAAWALAFQFFQFIIQKFNYSFPKSKLLFLGTFIFAWIGAKIFFIFTSQGLTNHDYTLSSNFWLGGGFVFYGGLIFGLVFILLFQRKFKVPFESFQALIPPLALGHGLGRIGCFLAGCCYGDQVHNSHMFHFLGRYPVQLFEAGSLFVISFISYKLLKQKKNVVIFYMITYGLVRFILEFYRGDGIRGIWAFGLSTSQIISLALIFLATGLYIYQNIVRRDSI